MTGADQQWAAQHERGDILRYMRGTTALTPYGCRCGAERQVIWRSALGFHRVLS
jgi:hypothetical protein